MSLGIWGSGCESRQVAIFTVEGRAPNAQMLGAYSRINGGAWQGDSVRTNLDLFGVEVPIDTSGLLETQAFAYQGDVPCVLSSGSSSVEMPGKYRQNATLSMTMSASRCVGAFEPADFPTKRMAIWVAAPNDIWLAGEGGRILRWNGTLWTKVPLPPPFAAAPPQWNAIYGRSPQDVWFVGTGNAVARFFNNALQSVTTMGATATPDWEAITPGDPNLGDLWFAGSQGSFGYVAAGAGTATYARFLCSNGGGPNVSQTLRGAGCLAATTAQATAYSGYIYRCMFVGDEGTILTYTLPALNGGYTCRLIPSGKTQTLRGVWLGLNPALGRWQTLVAGDGGLFLHGPAPLALATDPIFTGMYSDYSMNIPITSRVDFYGITGTGIDNLWIYGKRGVLLSWTDTAALDSMPNPFIEVPTGTQQDLTTGYFAQAGMFAAGPGPILAYNGMLFTPTP